MRPIDVAVDLGLTEAPLPEILPARGFAAAAPEPPPELVCGILHQGCKMILGGTSKANKSWCLLDMGISVGSGADWWGRQTRQTDVVYINFELHPWAMAQRLRSIIQVRPECSLDRLHVWNLRGHNSDLTLLRPKLEEGLARHQYGLIILDPAYKLLGDRDENQNGEIANLMNEFEALAGRTGAAIVLAHHFAKGDSSLKTPIDRMSGAGAWARDPDTILILTPHEEQDCYTVSPVLRNLPSQPEFVLRWSFPLMQLATALNPEALRRTGARAKACTDMEFLEAVIGEETHTFTRVVDIAREQLDLSRSSVVRYLHRLVSSGAVLSSAGLYWKAPKPLGN